MTLHYFNKFYVTNLTGYANHILQLAMSPDRSMMASVSADETVRLWRCFIPSSMKNKETMDFHTIPTFCKLIR
jgi:WD40 repeat protein